MTKLFLASLLAVSSFAYAGSDNPKGKAKGTVRATTTVATPSASCNPAACKPTGAACSPAACKAQSSTASTVSSAPWLIATTSASCTPATSCK